MFLQWMQGPRRKEGESNGVLINYFFYIESGTIYKSVAPFF